MKRVKQILGTGVFLTIGLVLTVLTSYVLRPIDYGVARIRAIGFYGEKKNSLDIVGFGSSAMYRYVNSPELYAQQRYTSYMLASGDQPAYIVPELIDEVLRTQSPQLLLIETRKFVRWNGEKVKDNRFRIIADNLKYTPNRFYMIYRLRKKLPDPILSYYFDIMKYHENWQSIKRESFDYIFNEYKSPKKGWYNNNRQKAQKRPDIDSFTAETPIHADAEKEILRIIEKCKKRGVQVLFFESPYVIERGEQERVNYLKRLIEENGYQFLDANRAIDEIGIDYAVDFYNANHTNSMGAKKFTDYLGKYIQENYEIDTSLTDENVKEWQEAVALDKAEYTECEQKIMERVNKKGK